MKEIQSIISHLAATNGAEPGVLATLVTVSGSSYRRPGARSLITAAGLRLGSISGGCLEEDVMARARRVSATGRPELALYDTTTENDLVWGVGLGCHGVVQVLLEKLPPRPRWAGTLAENMRSHLPTTLAVVWQAADPSLLGTRLENELPSLASADGIFIDHVAPPVRLLVFGAGDDAQPLARLAKDLGWHVTIADPRPDFATTARFPSADALVVGPAKQLLARAAPPPDALAVVMTHHYVHDVPLLRDLLAGPFPYIGLLGPRQRAERILSDLERGGLNLPTEARARLHAPVGLDLGANTPEEVALSIIAEMRAALSARDGRPLRDRRAAIHA
ncbi:MAG TPA: XdhC/CoxI family protein [Opitutus sp.]|nr:XdhC/CoxI family protein [Opitutus sp.]